MIFDPGFTFDLCLIQESLLSNESAITDISPRWVGPSFWSPSLGRQGGVAILIKENFDASVISWVKDSCGRILSLLLQIANTSVNITNIYAPTDLTECKVFFELTVGCEITPCCLSDHDFVRLSLDFVDLAARGPGVWKFNNSFLDDDVFCNYISDRISDLASCRSSFDSVKSWWDFFKCSLKTDIISFARERRKSLCRERVSLTNRLINLRRQLISGDSSVSPDIVFIESQLAALIDRAAEGVKVRSRVQWLEEGEKPSRFFFKLERERYERNRVASILNSVGLEVSDRDEIEQAHVDFYTKLFSVEDIDEDCHDLLLNEISVFLTDSDSALCEGPISLTELTTSLKSQNAGKAPGPDGFSSEFYVKFWNLLGPLLLEVINQSFVDCELTEFMKASMTRLIFKKRGDIKDLKNWRPISLLNVDYKICSKVITLRLSRVLHVVVDPDQTCSVPGRSISSNIIQLRDTLDYIKQTNEPGILVSLDQEKAFDRVNRDFLMLLLERFGFGSDFHTWIATFYAGA